MDAELLSWIKELWPYVVAIVHVVVAVIASSHVVLYKRDSRAAVAWVGLIWFSPLFGAIFYWLFGINRIRRKAESYLGDQLTERGLFSNELSLESASEGLASMDAQYLTSLAQFVDEAVPTRLTKGNRITPLKNGDAAYPAMLSAIQSARESVSLLTYIFDNDEAGRLFVAALADAVKRNVEVRVLVDAVGARYSVPPIIRSLKHVKVKVARFLPTALPWYMAYMNLRNHRKLLVVDGEVGFTGGLNIRQSCLVEKSAKSATQDLHFKIEGPVVAHLQETFATDWEFSTKEHLKGEKWFPRIEGKGTALARGIPDGPGANFETIRWAILGAISMAKSRIRIVTPYFLPDSTVITALNVAAMSGIRVEIILPRVNNLKFVQWACAATVWQLLQQGCRIFLSQPPFDHSKIMIVDDAWVLLGSSNWDSRSLRLNFEFNVECYDTDLASKMHAAFESKLQGSQEITLAMIDNRSLPIKLRDGVARLMTPYL